MPLQIKPDYTNPLTMLKRSAHSRQTRLTATPDKKTDKIKELQTKQQQLQNEMLLIKSNGSASGDLSTQRQEEIKKRMEEIASDLRTAKADTSTSLTDRKQVQDYYKKEDDTAIPDDLYRRETYNYKNQSKHRIH